MDGFLKIIAMLKEQAIPCELIVDGSYLTEEIEPDDIDFSVVVSPDFYDEIASDSQRKLLDWIGDDKTIPTTHLSDCYLCVEYREGDRFGVWFQGFCDKDWWVSHYSKSVIYKRDRGVAIIDLGKEGT